MFRTTSRLFVVLALVAALFCTGVTAALAGTTGSLSGKVLDATSQAPIAGAKVTAASPSGSSSTVSDKNGSFTFISIAPDTYALSVSYAGYDIATTSGITIQSDQTATFNVTLAKTIKQIGRVQSRSTASLIQPGVSTDVYNISAAQQRAAATLGGGGGLNNAYSAIASVPGVFVPQGQSGEYQSIFIRGANYTQVGYEYDGVPIQRAFDQYPGNNLSNLGQQEVQVYVGSAPTSTGSTALAGFINQVIRTGTYPGFASAQLGFGGPTGYKNLRLEGGGSTPNRSFNYYVGTGGYAQDIRYERGNQFDAQYGGLLDTFRSNCSTATKTGTPTVGCYRNTAYTGSIQVGPNGYVGGPLFWGFATYQTDRDTVANFHWGIPHKKNNDGGRDDVQFLYNTTLVQTYYGTAPTDWGGLQDQINTGTYNGNPPCPTPTTGNNCNRLGAQPGVYNDKIVYTGPVGRFLTTGNVTDVRQSYFPGSPTNRAFGAAIDPFERDNYQQNASIVKLQYQRNFDSKSYARVYGYTEYSDWLQYGEGGLNPNYYGSISQDYKLGSHTRGVGFTYANQINDKHLLNFSGSYTTATTFRNNNAAVLASAATTTANSTTVAFLVDSTNPTNGLCYTGAGAPVNCAAAGTARYFLPGAPNAPLAKSAGSPDVGAAGAVTCGGGPCAYFSVANGNAATYNTVTPKFTALSLADKWQVNSKLSLDLGLRFDDFKYMLVPTEGGPARQFWVNYFNRFNCYDPNLQQLTTANPANGTALDLVGHTCAFYGLQSVSFSSHSDPQEDYPELQPRIGATYTVNRNNVLRLSYGKYAQPASSAFQQYDTIQPNFIAANSTFYPIGFHTPSHRILPEESYNLDASWEHQFNGTDASFKVTPFLRQTKNELTTIVLDIKTSFVSGINVGHKNVKGLEFALQKGDPAKDGLYGSLSYTYTFARLTFDTLSNGTTLNTALNNAIAGYNAYTSYCTVTNPGDPRCKINTGAASYLAGVSNRPTKPIDQYTATGAAACFTAAGAPDPACGAGSIANPYWNMPVQSLFDPAASYTVYNTYSGGARGTGSNQSYIAPHVLTFIGNYKRGRFNVTPTAQFQGGATYGRPLQALGIDPARGCTPINPTAPAASTGTDPRYPVAQPGAPYDASTCPSAIAVPNPFVGHFDNYGQYTQPNKFSFNLSTSYDLSKQMTFRLDFVNVLNTCWGGSNVPWKVGGKAGCDYAGGLYVGNFYNPGDQIQSTVQYPYTPNFGGTFQQTTGGQANPFQVYATINVKL
jgi:Carboxypeptidase regulatory-like domain/TonB dependent receptor-like, beta-barrel/TonB-dependent Receptor Plug Domain